MLLSDAHIRDRRLVHDYVDGNFRATSYDLSVGVILDSDGKEQEQFKLKPSGVAEVVSRERITLPHDITGLAMVKTGLCNRGILALNIGIIGPGYDGYLSTTLLNFSKTDFLLTKGEVFLRLIFQECYESPRDEWPKAISLDQYVVAKKKSLANFSDKFLNLDTIVKEITKPIWTQALAAIPVIALSLAVMTFFLTVTVNYANRQVWSKDEVDRQNIKKEISTELAATRDSGQQPAVQALQERVKELEATQREILLRLGK